MEKRDNLPSHAVQALQAHNSNKLSKTSQANQVPKSTEDIKSLNQLLQWATANSVNTDKDNSDSSSSSATKPTRTPEQLKQDRQWLDVAFPDVYADVRVLVSNLDSDDHKSRLNALEDLQELFLDLNHAVNIEKVGALEPILNIASSSTSPSDERATAIWILGTVMQHLSEMKTLMISKNAHVIIIDALSSSISAVRAKAVMAASALLQHADDASIRQAFKQADGYKALRQCLTDPQDSSTRKRARFFLAHATQHGNQDFVDDCIANGNTIAAFVTTLTQLDVDDYADVETAIQAMSTLFQFHSQSVLQVAPELPGILDELAGKCTDEQLVNMVRELADKMP